MGEVATGYSNRQAAGPAWRPPLAICFLSVWELIFLSIPSHDPVSSRLTDKHLTVTPTCRFPDFFHGSPTFVFHVTTLWPWTMPLHEIGASSVRTLSVLPAVWTPYPSPFVLQLHWALHRVEFLFLPNQVTFAFLPFLSQWHFVWTHFCSNCLLNRLRITWLSPCDYGMTRPPPSGQRRKYAI